MSVDAREFIEFWVENSVHAAEPFGIRQAGEQNAAILAVRCIEAAKVLHLSRDDLEAAVGDLVAYMRARSKEVNELERRKADTGQTAD